MTFVRATLVSALVPALLIGCKSSPTAQQPAATQTAPAPAAAPAPGTPTTGASTTDQTSSGAPAAQTAPSSMAPATSAAMTGPQPGAATAPPELVIPAGTMLRVRLDDTLSSNHSSPGDSFSATVEAPVVVHGATLIRKGSTASGTVVDAKALGHFKGQALLSIRLDRVRVDGRSYPVATSSIARVEQGKGKRTAGFVGGGAGLGAILGGLAGGGKGVLIGGLVGAGAGTAGGGLTGNKDLVLPAETLLTFRVTRPVHVE